MRHDVVHGRHDARVVVVHRVPAWSNMPHLDDFCSASGIVLNSGGRPEPTGIVFNDGRLVNERVVGVSFSAHVRVLVEKGGQSAAALMRRRGVFSRASSG